MRGRAALLGAALLLSSGSFAQAPSFKNSPATITADKLSVASLTSAQSSRLAALNSQHLQAKSRLPKDQQGQMDRLAQAVKTRMFAAPLDPDLLTSATQTVHELVPGLDDAEAASMAEYALGAIAAGTPASAETQMSFNLSYLQLQSKMRAVNRSYEMLGNVLKTKHDTVKNSIGNIR
jgi:hypothetical protein